MGAITAEIVDTGDKHDTRGRRVVPRPQRLAMVEAYRASGLPMAQFARREGITYSTFAGWVAKAGKAAPAKTAIKFAEVQLPTVGRTNLGPALEVQLPDGTVLRGGRVADVVALVRALRA